MRSVAAKTNDAKSACARRGEPGVVECPNPLSLPGADELAVELAVRPAARQQHVVRAALDDLTMVQHQQQISMANRREAVGDDKAGSAFEQQGQGTLQTNLGEGIDGTGGLVEDDQSGSGQHGTGEADYLALTQ